MPSTRRTSAQHSSEAVYGAEAANYATTAPTMIGGTAAKSTSRTRSQPSEAAAATAAPAADAADEPSTDAHIELLTEHFGFNPKAFIDALVYLANEHLYKLAEQFEIAALDQLQDLEGGDLEAEQGVHAVLTLLENALDHTLDTFELYCLRSVFGVKARQARLMTLAHHRGLDLRPRNASTVSSKSAGRSRKSLASVPATSEALSASEQSHQLGAEEDTLKRKLAAARSVQHDLLLAKQAAEARLSRTQLLHERFSALLSGTAAADGADAPHPDEGPSVTAMLGQQARKIRVDAEMLLRNLEALRGEDPLGKPLMPSAAAASLSSLPSGAKLNGTQAGKGSDSGDEAAEGERRVWERGREAYLNWEAERMVAKVRSAANVAETNASDESTSGETTKVAEEGKTPKRRKTALATPASQRRKATATATAGAGQRRATTSSDDADEAEVLAAIGTVGDVAEMDRIAAALRQR
ncbi:hypothetical protein ACQY0O_006027 [Thecaphora frezii]